MNICLSISFFFIIAIFKNRFLLLPYTILYNMKYHYYRHSIIIIPYIMNTAQEAFWTFIVVKKYRSWGRMRVLRMNNTQRNPPIILMFFIYDFDQQLKFLWTPFLSYWWFNPTTVQYSDIHESPRSIWKLNHSRTHGIQPLDS